MGVRTVQCPLCSQQFELEDSPRRQSEQTRAKRAATARANWQRFHAMLARVQAANPHLALNTRMGPRSEQMRYLYMLWMERPGRGPGGSRGSIFDFNPWENLDHRPTRDEYLRVFGVTEKDRQVGRAMFGGLYE